MEVREIQQADRPGLREQMVRWWGSEKVVTRGRLVEPAGLEGWVAVDGDRLIGALTYELHGQEAEIVTLNAEHSGKGIGTALTRCMMNHARETGYRRVWLITTNDNLAALRFYQKRGLHLTAIYPNALDTSRKLKPQIPLIGECGIPIRDELELEITFGHL